MNLDNLKSIIYNEFQKNNLIKKQENNKIYIDEKNLNKILTIIFNESSKELYSFSILKKEYGKCFIILFDNQSLEKKEFIIQDIEENHKLKSKLYKIKYAIFKSLRIVPIIGPDGVGKTTLLTNVMKDIKDSILYERFKKIVRRSIIYNIVYPINKIILKKQYGKRLEKDQYDDVNSKLIILAGLLYYPYLILNTILFKKLIFVDRFFQDILLKNISFPEKNTQLRDRWKLLLKFIPTVFWKIHLDAKTDIIMKRKDELTKDDIDKYRELNFKIYLEKPSFNYSYINTSNNIENCKNSLLYIGKNIEIIKKGIQ